MPEPTPDDKPRAGCRRWLGWTILAVSLLVLLNAAVVGTVYTDYGYICEYTGSQKGHRTWLHMLDTGNWYRASLLEDFIRTKYPAELDHRWTSYAGTGHDLFGMPTSWGHGSPGPIFEIKTDLLNLYVQSLDDRQKKTLYDSFKSGKPEDQKTVVDTIQTWVIRNANAPTR